MTKTRWLFTSACVALAAALFISLVHTGATASHAADAPPAAATDDVAALKAEVARLKGMVPDQSHAMADVGYHFANLWFAAQAENWPLAQFYADETRSHLKWAVRIIPKRKDREGREVDLVGILEALEKGSLQNLSDAVKSKDKERFVAMYNKQMANCMACHQAASKEFIRVHVPERPDAAIVEFKPDGR